MIIIQIPQFITRIIIMYMLSRVVQPLRMLKSYRCSHFKSCAISLDELQHHNMEKHIFSVAPMMEYTDRHMRYLMRLISAKSTLYTEMVTANALVRTDEPNKYLEAELGVENPVVLQLGGACPKQVKQASEIALKAGYQEINLNVGCPSEKVAGAGCFGAALMLQPQLVSELALAIGEVTGQPATVKCRIGVDDADSYEQLAAFINRVSLVGHVRHFIVHARKAVLGGNFSPGWISHLCGCELVCSPLYVCLQ